MTLPKSNTRLAFAVSLLTLFQIGKFIPKPVTGAITPTSSLAVQSPFNESAVAQIPDYAGFSERVQQLEGNVASLRKAVDACEQLAAELTSGTELGSRYTDCLQLPAQLAEVTQELAQVLDENASMGEFTNYGPLLDDLSTETAGISSQLDQLIPWLKDIGLRREQRAKLERLQQEITSLQRTVEDCEKLIENKEALSENQRQQCEGLGSQLQTLQAKHDAFSSEMTGQQERQALKVLSTELNAIEARLPLNLPKPPNNPESGTTEPGTTQPGTTQPGTTQPGTTQPGTTQPGTTQP
ncbi:MAG: hypothetical protein AAFU53_16190, partial [Cyanobacteria bacterium J06632_3]